MQLSKRQFLASTAAALLAPGLLRASTGEITTLTAKKSMHQLAPDSYPETELWSFNSTAPGPELRLPKGGRLHRRLVNGLEEGTSIHWHGIRIDNAMDGVSGLTQDAVAPGAQFDYDFTVPDAGTYWYHAHNNSMEQVARGLYGPLIVEEAERPDIDAEHVLVLDDWRLTQTAEIDPDFAAPHDLSHAGRMGNYIATNATFDLKKTVKQHQRLRLRLINASNARIFSLTLQGLEGWIMAYDGMPLPSPERIEKEFILAPAQRMDLFVDVIAAQGEEAYLVRLDQDKGAAQVSFVVEGQGSSVRRDTPVVLPPNADPALNDIDSANRVTMKIEGGAMGSLSSAMLDGKNVSFRDMSSAGKYWAMAGNVGMPDTPLVDAGRGETVRISMVNESAFPHAMHLHGMHFREVMPDGSFGPLRDTYLLPGRETREIAFLADNPGKWLFHCHMLGHAAAGMMQWMRVA